MRRNSLSFIILVAFCLFFFAGCSNTSPTAATSEALLPTATTSEALLPTATTSEALLPTETIVAGMPTEPTIMPTPTAIPPLPCTITFDTDRDGNQEIYRMAPDGSDTVNLTNNPAYDVEPAWSPDGSQIVFVSNRPKNKQEGGNYLHVMDADGSNVRQLTFENESAWPDWSHDGSQITYSNKGDIYVIKADGSGQSVNLTNSPEQDEQPTWSPDGSQIAWLSGNDGKWNIFVMNADGSHVLQLTDNGEAYDVTWTIDGEIFSHWNHPDGICSKCVMGADGSNARDAGGKGEQQRFMPFRTLDGDRVECISGDLNTGNEEIYLVGEIYPDIFLNLSNNPGNDRNPDWPANCLSGFEGGFPIETAAPEIESTNPPNELVFGYAGDKPEQRERARDMQIACDELGIQCVYGEIPELIEKGVDAIIQNTDKNSVNGLHEDILKARDNGIPVFLLDAEAITDGAYSITIDYNHWAKTSLGWMLEKIGSKGQIAYFDLDPVQRYTDTIKDLLSRYPEITVVEFRDGKYDPEKIKPETGDFIKKYPDLKAIWTSYYNFQAMWGLEENSIPYKNWPVMVCEANRDGLLTWKRVQDAYPNFDCFAVANPPGIAYDAVYAAFYLVSGYKIDESVLGGEFGHTLYVNLPTVTKDNFQEKLNEMLKNDTWQVDELMSPEEIKEKWFLE
jgi:TolB protein